MKRTFFTSESVMEGHPDKLCDQIADGILDAILKEDPFARVACDVSASTGLITVFGQITTVSTVDIPAIVRSIIQAVGYTDSDFGIDGKACSVLIGLDRQSPDIAAGVGSSLEKRLGSDDEADQLGAGDQGLMFGYACKETPELMPLPIMLAHRLAKKVAELRKSGELLYLRPDGKTQVTVEYADGHVKRIEAVVIACQHDESVDQERIREDMLRMVIPAVIRRSRWMIRRNISSMPPAVSSSAVLQVIRDGPVKRLSSILMVVMHGMAEAPSPGRTRPKSTAPPHTLPDMWRRTSWLPAWQTAVKSSWPMSSEWRGPFPSVLKRSGRLASPKN